MSDSLPGDPPGWLILATERYAEPCQVRVGGLSCGDYVTYRSDDIFPSPDRAHAEERRCRYLGHDSHTYALTVVPVGGPALPPLAWVAGPGGGPEKASAGPEPGRDRQGPQDGPGSIAVAGERGKYRPGAEGP